MGHFQCAIRLTTRGESIDYAGKPPRSNGAGGRNFFPGERVTRITKDCFGTVIASLKKMKECVRCELLAECRAINWQARETEEKPSVVRRSPKNGDASNNSPA